jgi:membrane fusion protein, multidrug efflux system
MSRSTELEHNPADAPASSPPPPQPEAPARREKARSWFREHPIASLAAVLVLLSLIAGGLWAWSYYSVRESTDDARIDGHVAPVSARVGGTVVDILVEENTPVQAGQVLARIDDRDYKIALQRAASDLAAQQATAIAARTQIPIASASTASGLSSAQGAQAEAQAGVAAANENIANARARITQAEAQLRSAIANRDRAAKDVERYKLLIAKDEIPRQQFDTAVTAAQATQAQVESAEAAVAQARAGVDVAESQLRQAQARVAQAQSGVSAAQTGPQQVAVSRAQANTQQAVAGVRQSAVDQARLNLEYTVIRAPVAGILGRRTVQIGQNVQPGQPLFSVVETANLWVTAMFKETQLARMQPGQPVTVEVDAFGGEEIRAHVDSIGAATGGTFSVLPSENASGNYVKVVQRIPVKIVFEPDQPLTGRLRPGMSVVPTVLLK